MSSYLDFTKRFKLFASKNPSLITTTLSNIFTMRLVGNKTHGDLAEIGIAEFINQFMYDFKSVHVGKDLYRAKEREEDISIINEISGEEFPVSLKAYGDGPLQLSTDRHFTLYPELERLTAHLEHGSKIIEGHALAEMWASAIFSHFGNLNILPLIYDEKKQKCNILVFNHEAAMHSTHKIVLEQAEGRRKHPVFRFYDGEGHYICEVRYGSGTANALQRGLWTHTRNGLKYFDSITSGWIDYSHNHLLVKLFSHGLIATASGHQVALEVLKKDIEEQKLKRVQ